MNHVKNKQVSIPKKNNNLISNPLLDNIIPDNSSLKVSKITIDRIMFFSLGILAIWAFYAAIASLIL